MHSYGRSKYAAYHSSANKQNGLTNKTRKDSTSNQATNSIFGSPSIHHSSMIGDYIDNSSFNIGAPASNRHADRNSSTIAVGAAPNTTPNTAKETNKNTNVEKKGKGGTGAQAEEAGEADSEEGDDSKIDEEEEDDQISPDVVIEENQPVKVRENQYKLIYPSADNTEFEYMQYITYAT